MLTDNGDGTWSTTLEVAPGAHEFKFINGAGWNGGEENMNGTSCNASGNRGAEFDEENNTYEACFNICPGESCLLILIQPTSPSKWMQAKWIWAVSRCSFSAHSLDGKAVPLR